MLFSQGTQRGFRAYSLIRRPFFLFSLITLVFTSILVLASKTSHHFTDGIFDAAEYVASKVSDDASDDASDDMPGDRRLVYILPADNPGPSLCKVIFSGMALGYPSPVVVNWKENHHDRNLAGSHLMKITGTLQYLDSMTHETAFEEDRLQDDDLVVLVDAYDIWWQLPPSILISRYHEANKVANERLAREYPTGRSVDIRQTIIASSQKRCWPTSNMPSKLHCEELPESPMRPDLYGSNTDSKNNGGEMSEYHDIRPRYMNSGTIIGPVGDMKRYLRRVQERMDRTIAKRPELWSDQGVFAEIWAEQEMWRGWAGKLNERGGLPDDEVTGMTAQEFEFHVGLDYTQQLFIATVFEEEDGDIITLNNKTGITDRSRELGIDPVRLKGVPTDISATAIPLKRVESAHGKLDWGEMPMYADFFSAAVPVAVHHNAHRDGLKGRRVWWWDRMWYFPYLRDFVNDHLRTPHKLEDLYTLTSTTPKVVYKPLPSEKHMRKPRLFKPVNATTGLREMEFDELCFDKKGDIPWYDEVFRDEKGPL